MEEIALEEFIKTQKLTLNWRTDCDDYLMENTVTLLVNLKDGSNKVLCIHPYGVLLYQSYYKNLKLFSWKVGQDPSALKCHIESWIDQDVDNLFYEVASLVAWRRDHLWQVDFSL